jgi:hypothetical protein
VTFLLVPLLATVAAGCGYGFPGDEAVSDAPADRIECGAFEGEAADCVFIEQAAAKVVAAEPGSRAEVTTVAPRVYHVTFVSPRGVRSSADVVVNAQGQFVGANPSFGP